MGSWGISMGVPRVTSDDFLRKFDGELKRVKTSTDTSGTKTKIIIHTINTNDGKSNLKFIFKYNFVQNKHDCSNSSLKDHPRKVMISKCCYY